MSHSPACCIASRLVFWGLFGDSWFGVKLGCCPGCCCVPQRRQHITHASSSCESSPLQPHTCYTGDPHSSSVLVHALCIPAGSLLATGSLDSSVKVWRVADGSCVQTLEGPGDGIDWVAWHPKGDILLAGSEDFTMWMWLAQTGNCMQVRGYGCCASGMW
jgi:WD40 repeat protein